MAEPLKTRGRQELGLLKKRVQRQLGMERISKSDADQLLDLIGKIDSKIVSMDEKMGEEEIGW